MLAHAYVTLPALSRKPCRHTDPVFWQGLGEAEALPSLFLPFQDGAGGTVALSSWPWPPLNRLDKQSFFQLTMPSLLYSAGSTWGCWLAVSWELSLLLVAQHISLVVYCVCLTAPTNRWPLCCPVKDMWDFTAWFGSALVPYGVQPFFLQLCLFLFFEALLDCL